MQMHMLNAIIGSQVKPETVGSHFHFFAQPIQHSLPHILHSEKYLLTPYIQRSLNVVDGAHQDMLSSTRFVNIMKCKQLFIFVQKLAGLALHQNLAELAVLLCLCHLIKSILIILIIHLCEK